LSITFPDVPVRQWVLNLPHRLRYVLAWDHALCRAVTGVAVRTILGFLRHRARRDGVDGRSGAVVIIQRFGGALNRNIHLHALVLDGVFTSKEESQVKTNADDRRGRSVQCRGSEAQGYLISSIQSMSALTSPVRPSARYIHRASMTGG
jgi:putative transposase